MARGNGTAVGSVHAQPQRLALLAYLAVARPVGFRRRDHLLATFWPETDAEHARDELRRSIHFIRQSLGHEVIPSRSDEEVGVDSERLTVNSLEFEALVRAGETSAALQHDRGQFLDGLHVPGVPDLERWLDDERASISVATELHRD
ncbi:MAG: hypothetical protein AMXMBFR53_21310 [Gemmatimonadota bacterium]